MKKRGKDGLFIQVGEEKVDQSPISFKVQTGLKQESKAIPNRSGFLRECLEKRLRGGRIFILSQVVLDALENVQDADQFVDDAVMDKLIQKRIIPS